MIDEIFEELKEDMNAVANISDAVPPLPIWIDPETGKGRYFAPPLIAFNLYKAAAITGLCSHEQMIFPQVLADKAHEIALAAIKAEGTNNQTEEK